MATNFKKGFTLVELLMIIVIIGILSIVVLSFLTTARNSSRETKAISSLSEIGAEARLVYANTGSYNNVCQDANIVNSIGAAFIQTKNTVICKSDAVSWAVADKLSVDKYFCADYTGVATTTGTDKVFPSSPFSCR